MHELEICNFCRRTSQQQLVVAAGLSDGHHCRSLAVARLCVCVSPCPWEPSLERWLHLNLGSSLQHLARSSSAGANPKSPQVRSSACRRVTCKSFRAVDLSRNGGSLTCGQLLWPLVVFASSLGSPDCSRQTTDLARLGTRSTLARRQANQKLQARRRANLYTPDDQGHFPPGLGAVSCGELMRTQIPIAINSKGRANLAGAYCQR